MKCSVFIIYRSYCAFAALFSFAKLVSICPPFSVLRSCRSSHFVLYSVDHFVVLCRASCFIFHAVLSRCYARLPSWLLLVVLFRRYGVAGADDSAAMIR